MQDKTINIKTFATMKKIEYSIYLITAANAAIFGFATMIRCLLADYTIVDKAFYSTAMFLIGLIGVGLAKHTFNEYREERHND